MSQALGPARGGRKVGAPLFLEVLRDIDPSDFEGLNAPVGSAAPQIKALRAAHHQLAQLLAQGMPNAEAALVTGYSISRISILKADPTFQELLTHYSTQAEIIQIDVIKRMTALGVNSLETLQERLDDAPESFSNGALMDLAELMLVKGRAGPGGGPAGQTGNGGGSGGANIQITFVDAVPQAAPPRPVIDLDVESEG